MFGHQNDVISQDQQADASVPMPDSALNALASTPTDPQTQDNPSAQDASGAPVVQKPAPSATDGFIPPDPHPMLPDHSADQQPAAEEPKEAPEQNLPAPEPLEQPSNETPTDSFIPGYQEDAHTDFSSDLPADHAASAPSSDLLKIKQDALQSLSPLVHTLDLKAEDRFRTLMMLIQASDDQSLLPEAYQAAQAIEDEKAKAQALLDVVNEINYFTQHQNQA